MLVQVWKDASSPQPKISIQLHGVSVHDVISSKSHVFELLAPGVDKISLKAENLEVKERWLELLGSATKMKPVKDVCQM